MFYKILRQITATLFKVYFRKIYLIDLDQVPQKGPILIACNHPMAFTEACLLACFLTRPLHFLVRGDVFKSNWQWFFQATNQIPIYRFRDGFSNMRRNSESFAKAHEALSENKAILIFSEGNTKLQKKLSPLQKGTARMAFGAHENLGVNDIKIVPVGVNYDDGKSFRSDVAIKVGKILNLSDYLLQYKNDHHEAFRTLTEDLYDQMLPLVIHIEEGADEPLVNRIFKLYRHNLGVTCWPILDRSAKRFVMEKEMANQINEMTPKEKVQLSELVRQLESQNSRIIKWSTLVVLIIGIPFLMLGYLLNAIPFYLAKYIAFNKVKKDEFLTPVRLGLMMVLYIVWLLLALGVMSMILGWYALIAIWIFPLTGYVVIVWKETFDRLLSKKNLSSDDLRKLDNIFLSSNT